MQVHTFTAATMSEAVALVKHKLGPHAVILHTRTYEQRRWFGLRRREVFEITALPADHRKSRERGSREGASRDGVARESRRRDGVVREGVAGDGGVTDATRPVVGASSAPRSPEGRPTEPAGRDTPLPTAVPAQGARHAAAAEYTRNSHLQRSPAVRSVADACTTINSGAEPVQVMFKGFASEISELRSEVRRLVENVRSTSSPLSRAPDGSVGSGMSEELYRHYERLLQHAVAAELAEDIVKSLRLQVPKAYLNNESFLRVKMAEQLEKLIPAAGPIRRTKISGPHVVALIGPTGVGKTTTVAKLAAELQLRQGRRVGLITIDTYRIAAVDQLRKYAEIIGSPLQVVNTPEEMPDALAAMKDLDYVLIDTAGRSPTDTLKLSELRRFLDSARPDEVHLVLSTASDGRSVDLAVSAFSAVRVDRVLFTKIDEAAAVGVVLNVARKLNKAISYITTGQDVPDDIEVFRGRRLAELILGEGAARGTAEAVASTAAGGPSDDGPPATLSSGVPGPRLTAAGGVQ